MNGRNAAPGDANRNTDELLRKRLEHLDRRPTPATRRAQRTKAVTAGASATAVVGLTLLYGVSNRSRTQSDTIATADAPSAQSDALVEPNLASDQLLVTVDANGNLMSYPADVDPEVLAEAVANKLATQPTTSLLPVDQPETIELAIPPVDAATATVPGDDSSNDVDTTEATAETTTTTAAATTTTATTTTTTTTSASSATGQQSTSRRAPQAKSSGS